MSKDVSYGEAYFGCFLTFMVGVVVGAIVMVTLYEYKFEYHIKNSKVMQIEDQKFQCEEVAVKTWIRRQK